VKIAPVRHHTGHHLVDFVAQRRRLNHLIVLPGAVCRLSIHDSRASRSGTGEPARMSPRARIAPRVSLPGKGVKGATHD
jgi:hypothetical protein